jgi:hypothetical protein
MTQVVVDAEKWDAMVEACSRFLSELELECHERGDGAWPLGPDSQVAYSSFRETFDAAVHAAQVTSAAPPTGEPDSPNDWPAP